MNEHPRPRLLIVGAFPPPGTRIFGGIVSACAALLDSSLPRRANLQLLDTTQISNPPPRLPVRLLLAIKRSIGFVGSFERLRPHAVMLFAAPGASLVEKGAMAWYCRLRGVPALLFPRGGGIMDDARRSGAHRFLIRWLFKGAAMVLCQGPKWQTFAHEICGFDPSRAPVIPNWTASSRLLGIARRRFEDPAENSAAPHIVFVGWLEEAKGIFELIDAAVMLAGTRDFRVSLVGDGNAREVVSERIRAAGLSERISLLGWQPREAVDRLLASAEIFVLPSYAEGLPNALVEAMAAGLPVVVTPVGAIPDYITDRQNGLLVPPRDARALAQAMRELIDEPGLRRRLAVAGNETVAGEFTVEVAVDRIIEAVDKARAASHK